MPVEFNETPGVVTIREMAARGPKGDPGSGGGGSGSGITVSAVAPEPTEVGDLWVDTGTDIGQAVGNGLRLVSDSFVSANFPWIIRTGDIVNGSGSITYLWTPAPGDGTSFNAYIVGAPVANLPVNLAMIVRNLTGDQMITVIGMDGRTQIEEGALFNYYLNAESDVAAQVGTDLSYDVDFGFVVRSAAGGVFLVQAVVSVSND